MNKNKKETSGTSRNARLLAFILAAIMIFSAAATLIAVLLETGNVY